MSDVLFNPAFLSQEDTIRGFVVRQDVLRDVLTDIEAPNDEVNHHLLVIGPRGFGKSTLVHRVVAEIRSRPELDARWYPIVFPEEPYEVRDIGEFWLEGLYRLADQTGDPEWQALRQSLHRDRDAARVERVARDALRTFAARVGKRLVLVVENLDMLLGENLSDADGWALRKVLQDDPTFMLLATAARRFEGFTDHNKPFYDGLRRVELLPLSAAEICTLWGDVAGKAPPLPRGQAVRVLTGGNPRMVRLLAQLVRGDSLRAVVDELTGLVDRHTDYFKGNIEALSGDKRRVFLAVATLWRPAGVAQIAEEARMDGNTVSAVLSRLEAEGRLEVVARRGRNKIYQVAERLYNIYYLMRRRGGPDARVQALVDFMVRFYEPEALGDLTDRLVIEHREEGVKEGVCLEVLESLLREVRANPDARQAILGSLPADFLERMPGELKVTRRRPEEMLALVQGVSGESFVEDAVGLVMSRFAKGKSDERDLALGLWLLRNMELPPFEVAFCIGLIDPEAALALVSEGRLTGAQHSWLFFGAAFALIMSFNPDLARRWLAVEVGEKSIEDVDGPFVPALHALLHPDQEEKVMAALQRLVNVELLLPLFVQSLLGRMTGAVRRRVLEFLIEQYSEAPWSLAAQAIVWVKLGEPDQALGPAEALLHMGRFQASSHRLLAHVYAANRRYKDALEQGKAALTLGDRDPLLREWVAVVRVLGGKEDQRGRIAQYFAENPGNRFAWMCGLLLAPELCVELWAGVGEAARATLVPSLILGAVKAENRMAWELAAKAAESVPGEAQHHGVLYCLAVIFGLLGRPDRALLILGELLARDGEGAPPFADMLRLALSLSCAGQTTEVLRLLRESPHPERYRPLILALDAPSPDELPSAEESALAEDIRARLEALRESPDIWSWRAKLSRWMQIQPPELSAFVEAPTPPPKRRPRTAVGTSARGPRQKTKA